MSSVSPQFSKNQSRVDPYKGFKFRVLFGNKIVAGVSKVSALKRSTEVVSHREGNESSTSHHSPGASSYEAITLERGVSYAPEFEEWADMVHNTNGDGAVSLLNFRKEIRIELLNLQGSVVRAYDVHRCWVSEYTALPELDANSNSIAFETIVLQNEGFTRDPNVMEQTEF